MKKKQRENTTHIMWIIVILFLNLAIKEVQGARMDDTPLRIRITAGGNAALPCSVSNLGNYTVLWMGPNSKILFVGEREQSRDDRITLTKPYITDWNLHIKGVKRSDEGVYMCKVYTSPIQEKQITLEVNVPPRITKSSSTQSTSAEEGGNVTLTCTATGVPTPKFLWHVKHKDSDKKQQLVDGDADGSFTLQNVTRQQAGTYMCTAVNGIGSPDTHEMKVSINFPPEITTISKNVREYQGRSTKLVCEMTLYPIEAKNLYWVKGGFTISSQDANWKYKSQILTRDETTVQLWLDINYLERDDFGNYTCVAMNEYGGARDVIVLEEHVQTTKAPPTTTALPTTTTLLTTTMESTTITTTPGTTEGTTVGRETTLQLTSQTTRRTTLTTASSSSTTKTPVGPVVPPDPISPSYNVSSTDPKDQTDPGNSASVLHLNVSLVLAYTVMTLILTKLQRLGLT